MASKMKLVCAQCGQEFSRATKEISRQTKKRGAEAPFFCSMSCACTWNVARRSSESKSRTIETLRSYSTARRGQKFYKPCGEFSYYLRQAVKRDVPFDLDETYLSDLWARQGSRCALSEVLIHLKAIGQPSALDTASLDRINHLNGYIRGNVQFVALAINYAKNTFSDRDVRDFIRVLRAVQSKNIAA